ncbi:MAG: hypothetical protein HYY01_12110 [Chloroflexi bacterium]|nr:hypothetical protein [Chloroflexota bacterium]
MSNQVSQLFAIVTSPTESWLYSSVESCKARLLVASPYVNDAFLHLARKAPPSVEKVLITRTDLRDFAMGSSSLNTLCSLASDGVQVASLSGLHAKVYVFDNARALITSANATQSGMRSNWECGVAISDPTTVVQVASLVLSGLGAEEPPVPVSLNELVSLRRPLEALRAALPPIPRIKAPEAPEPIAYGSFKLADATSFLRAFAGWARVTLDAVLSQPNDRFSLSDMYATCAPLAARRYPNNRHVPDKVRQQLQKLRDLGLVEFLGEGNYRRTVSA